MIKLLKSLFSGTKPAPVVDPGRAVEILSEALYLISPDLWFKTLNVITKTKFPEFRIYRRRYGNKRGKKEGGDQLEGSI